MKLLRIVLKPLALTVNKVLKFRLLIPYPLLAVGTESANIINFLALKFGLIHLNYLEVGIEYGRTLESVKNNVRIGVDPKPRFKSLIRKNKIRIFPVTSSDFFGQLCPSLKFGIVFLDGLHTAEQTFEDLVNVSKHLYDNSFIVLDDTVPIDKWAAIPNQESALKLRKDNTKSDSGAWQGDVYRVVLTLRALGINNLRFLTIMDVSNPKTIIWATNQSGWSELADMSKIAIEPEVEFDFLISKLIPEQFNPIGLAEFTQNIEKMISN